MKNYLYNLATDNPKHQNFWRAGIVFLIKAFLFILSLIYGLIIRSLILFFKLKPYRLNCEVISVGNITLGGTGKTSLVQLIAAYLKLQNHKVAILSRGYKGLGFRFAVFGFRANTEHRTPNTEPIADEPYMLQQKLKDVPVIVDADRIRAGNLAINNYGVDTIILDDGFQQWKIHKNLEIVTIDATNPFGNKHMIPRGILREPIQSLARSDIFVLTKINLKSDVQELKGYLNKINPAAEIFESVHKPVGFYNIDNPQELMDPESLKGKSATLFSGIGDPDSLEKLITDLGIKVSLSLRFSDHHNYTQEDLDNIGKSSRERNADVIITTEKDAARLRSLQLSVFSLQLLVLRIAISIKDEQRFYNRLLKLYSL